MQADKNPTIKESWSVVHPLSPEDSAAMTALRSAVAAMKGKLEGVAARGPFNGIMERVATPDGVGFQADTVGGISGWWAKPAEARKGAAILHLHGGWFNWGTASAFRKTTPKRFAGSAELPTRVSPTPNITLATSTTTVRALRKIIPKP